MQLARLVLEHTAQTLIARHHLERAVGVTSRPDTQFVGRSLLPRSTKVGVGTQQLALQSCQGHFGLKCEVAAQLADCLGKVGQVKLQKQTLSKAVQYCQDQSQGTIRSVAWPRYSHGVPVSLPHVL